MRIKSFDFFKAIAAFMVVYLHYISNTDSIIHALFRIAVPFFFMVSGFFAYKADSSLINESCMRNVKKLVLLNIIVVILTFLKDIIRVFLGKVVFADLFSQIISWEFLLFNFKYQSYLWFVRCLIYCYIIYLLLVRLPNKGAVVTYFLVPVIILINLLFCKYSIVVFGLSFPINYYEIPSKFIGVGLTSFLIGTIISRYKQNCLEIKAGYIISILIITFCFYFVEYYLLNYFNCNVSTCDYLSTYLLSTAIFLFLVKFPKFGFFPVDYIGKKYSMLIYVLHMNIYGIVKKMINMFGAVGGGVMNILSVFVGYILCVIIAWILLQAYIFWVKKFKK